MIFSSVYYLMRFFYINGFESLGREILSLEEEIDELLSSDSVILRDHMSTSLEKNDRESLNFNVLSSVLSVVWVWILSVGWLIPSSPWLNGGESVLVSNQTGPVEGSGGWDGSISISGIDPDSVTLLDQIWVEVIRSGGASIVLPLVIIDTHVPGDVGVNVEGSLDSVIVEE